MTRHNYLCSSSILSCLVTATVGAPYILRLDYKEPRLGVTYQYRKDGACMCVCVYVCVCVRVCVCMCVPTPEVINN